MAFIKHKKIKGHSYRYLVGGYREGGKVKHRTLKYLGRAPVLSKDAPIAVVLFAGGGGVECGMIEAGIRPVLSVEYDRNNAELSEQIANSNHLNFKPYGGKVLKKSVQELAEAKFPDFPYQPDFLHASPVCSNFSRANDGKESTEDIEAAIAVTQAIFHLQPGTFTLENVPAYEKSESWKKIQEALEEEGYQITSGILDAADYGVAQSRKRFIVKAAKDNKPGLPPKQKRIGWFDEIADLIPNLPSSEMVLAQKKALTEKLSMKPELQALLIERIGFRDKPQAREPAEPCWTIRKSIFHDDKNANRFQFIDLWMADGTVKRLTVEAVARLQGFPQWYCLPDEVSVAGSILGYSVPPPMFKALVIS